MLKRSITYKDFDGNKVVEEHYFNFTRAELVEMEVAQKDGLHETLTRIIKTEDKNSLIQEFKNIILKSYGVKSEDGRRFIKNPELSLEFSQSLAYDALFMELATNDDAAANFIKGVIPAEMLEAVEQAQPQDKPKGLPPTPPKPPVL